MKFSNSWAILPASQCLMGKSKVTIKEIANEWKSGTVVICRKPNDQIHFIAGCSGSHVSKLDLGGSQDVHHDQNPGNRMGGPWTVINEVQYETLKDGSLKTTWIDENMELGKGANEDFKACMAVFK